MSFDNDAETSPEARAKWFTTTHWSVVLAARGSKSAEAEVALEQLCRVYWYPLYAYVRRQGNSPHDAQDLTQEFFARLLEKNYLNSVEREKGKFRSFLLASLNHFLSNQRDRAAAAKRGGGQTPISLDERTAEERYSLEPATTVSPEDAFEKRWAITLLEQALERVRAEFVANGKGELFEHLKTFLAEGTGSGESKSVAAQLGMTPNGVAVAVHRLRKTYREAVRAEIAQTVASPDQIEDEMRHLFAALI
jgi:RNA polymerase sigma-70 factor (ECF subfamily)